MGDPAAQDFFAKNFKFMNMPPLGMQITFNCIICLQV